MKLDQFVSETLKQILKGVSTAQEYAVVNGGLINPLETNAIGGAKMIYDTATGGIVEKVEFDVHVSVTTESSSSDGDTVGELTIAPDFQTGEQNTTSNRIKFSVPVLLPASTEK